MNHTQSRSQSSSRHKNDWQKKPMQRIFLPSIFLPNLNSVFTTTSSPSLCPAPHIAILAILLFVSCIASAAGDDIAKLIRPPQSLTPTPF